MIRQVHATSNAVDRGRRVHAELTLGRGKSIGHGAVELLMRRAGIKGCSAAVEVRWHIRSLLASLTNCNGQHLASWM